MTRVELVTRVVKPALYAAALLPLTYLVARLAMGQVEGDQVKFIQHVTGDTVLTSLLLTLSVTPLRRLTGWNELIRLRRLIGLTAFWYACLHLLTYLVFDQALSPSDIAITSTKGWVRRLGGKRWQRLHRLVYFAAGAGVLHYLWLVKKDLTAPIYYAACLAILLAVRLVRRPARRVASLPLSQEGSAR